MNKYMMGTTAIHQLGDISSDYPDLCVIHSEDKDNYIGSWVTGFGFIDVKFPKETTRDLTGDEIEYYTGMSIQINSNPPHYTLKKEDFVNEHKEMEKE